MHTVNVIPTFGEITWERHMTNSNNQLVLLACSVAMAVVLSPAYAQSGGEIEEIVVTGSYLKKATADSPSPLSVIDKADLDEIGAVDVKDVINSLTYTTRATSATAPRFTAGTTQQAAAA